LGDGSLVDGQLVPTGLLAKPAAAVPAGSVARDIVFVLPKLAAGASIDLVAELSEPGGAAASLPRLAWHEAGRGIDLLLGGKPVLRYEMPVYDPSTEESRVETYKPFHHVLDPVTGIRLTKGDGGQYTHHRGIFFGYNKITHGADGKTLSDCWHCVGKARQEHRRVLEQVAGPVEGRQRVAIDWIGSDGSTVLGETRELGAIPVPGGTIIEFASRLEAAGPVSLAGDPQHAGVHFRAPQEVHDSTRGETYYLRPGVRAKPGAFRNWPEDETYVDAPWHAASFVVGGQRYTVLRVNRAANPGEARMSERDYGRFGSSFEYDVAPGRPLEVGYRWWVQPGELSLEEAARIAADYQSPAGVVVSGIGNQAN
ncbi:MAG: hypothetical protein EBZ59_00115, partial [Planctomycetia bacterium]|nr:hypothetical protein [Planctomycetia bacterium]